MDAPKSTRNVETGSCLYNVNEVRARIKVCGTGHDVEGCSAAAQVVGRQGVGVAGYETFGPFTVPATQAPNDQRTLDMQASQVQEFWKEVESTVTGLSEACGCYIFAIRAGPGITPWYVGRSTTAFKRECFQPGKKVIYQEAYNEVRRGSPVLVLVARMTEGGKFSRGRLALREAEFVERVLMHRAWSRNPKLKNVSGLGLARELRIPGLLNSGPGAPSDGARLLRRTLGVRVG